MPTLGMQAFFFRLSALFLFFLHITAALPSPASSSSSSNGHNPPSLPGLVDLGYAKHIPSYVNTTLSGRRRLAVYKNIRFARPPTGDRRFRAPDTRVDRVDGVQDGLLPPGATTGCISAAPAWAPLPVPGLNGSAWGAEDCLFLDVYVPDGARPGDRLPVLHWVHGSGYAFDSAELSVHPLGLYDRVREGQEFIFVANHYRYGTRPPSLPPSLLPCEKQCSVDAASWSGRPAC